MLESRLQASFVVIAVACGSPAPAVQAPQPPPAPVAPASAPAATTMVEDPYLWLEDVSADRSLAWVRERNKLAQAELEAAPGFAALRDRFRAILDSKDRTPFVAKRGAYLYNTWTDEHNPKGLYRRTTLAEYRKAAPKWETVLDVDALAARDGVSWVFGGMTCLYPKFERCLVRLSRGGADAVTVRELDMKTRTFVEGGFTLSEAKSLVDWKDLDTVYVGTDFGPGSLTSSGYPRIVKEWKRGTPLAEAVTVFEGQPNDILVSAKRVWDHGRSRDLVARWPTTYTSEVHLRGGDGKLVRIDAPLDASVDLWADQLLITLRSDWTIGDKTWPRGALLATELDAFVAGKRDFALLFEPAPTRALGATTTLRSAIIVNELEDIHSKLYVWTRTARGWARKPFEPGGDGRFEITSVWPLDPAAESDGYWMQSTGFVTPATLSLGRLGGKPELLKRGPVLFDARGLVVAQHFAKSKDGTRVPYFMVSRAGLALDGSHPTLLYGYGGFESSLKPSYDPVTGAGWMERGGVYVAANIRGGGEYGPAWHQAALTRNRQRAFDDFIAVAEDLLARKVTSASRLGVSGGSNGGLLTGVMLTQRPELFGAVVSRVPLLDMKRYHKLLAGASWMEEYGDPDDPDDWAALAKYSPYHNVRAGVRYPRALFTSSTRDDRVHPGHARKMVARMTEQGHDVLYYENIEGGHRGSTTNEQAAYMSTLGFAFLARELGLQ